MYFNWIQDTNLDELETICIDPYEKGLHFDKNIKKHTTTLRLEYTNGVEGYFLGH